MEEYEPFLDIYIFGDKNITDDHLGLTEINNANTPRFNKYFDCVIYLNERILWEPFTEKEIYKKIKLLDNIKLGSVQVSKERSGWEYQLNTDTNNIGMVRI